MCYIKKVFSVDFIYVLSRFQQETGNTNIWSRNVIPLGQTPPATFETSKIISTTMLNISSSWSFAVVDWVRGAWWTTSSSTSWGDKLGFWFPLGWRHGCIIIAGYRKWRHLYKGTPDWWDWQTRNLEKYLYIDVIHCSCIVISVWVALCCFKWA